VLTAPFFAPLHPLAAGCGFGLPLQPPAAMADAAMPATRLAILKPDSIFLRYFFSIQHLLWFWLVMLLSMQQGTYPENRIYLLTQGVNDIKIYFSYFYLPRKAESMPAD